MDQAGGHISRIANAVALGWHILLAIGIVVGLIVFFAMLVTGRITLAKMKAWGESWWWWPWW